MGAMVRFVPWCLGASTVDASVGRGGAVSPRCRGGAVGKEERCPKREEERPMWGAKEERIKGKRRTRRHKNKKMVQWSFHHFH